MHTVNIWAILVLGLVAIPYAFVAIAALPRAARTFSMLLCSWCIGFFKWCRGSSPQGTGQNTDREQGLVRQHLAKIRCMYFSDLLHVWMHASGIISVLAVVKHLAALMSDSEAIGVPFSDIFTSTLLVCSCIVASLIRLYPRLMNENTLWIVHTLYMGILMCYTTYAGMLNEPARVALTSTLITSLFVVLGLAYPEPLPNLVWSAVWATTRTFVYLQVNVEGLQPGNIISSSLTALGFVLLVLTKIRQLQMSLVEAQLEAKGHLRAKETVEKVLADMCDAVVELDGQFVIKKPCAKLAGLLFKSAAGLTGEAFPGMIFNDDDRERFEEFVTPRTVPVEQEEDPDGNGRASSVYVRMRDADGTAVSVQLFHSCHQAPPNDVCHVLGVREVQEHDPAETLGQQMPIATMQASGGNKNDDAASVCSSASFGTASDCGTVLAPIIAESGMMDPISAIVNPTTMEIIGCTIGFQSFTGPLIYKGAVRDIIANYGSTFRSWMQEEVFGRVSRTEPSKFEIKLRPTMVRERQRLEFRGDAYVIHAQLDVCASDMGLETGGDEEEEHDALCVLALRDLESHVIRSKRKATHTTRATTEGNVGARHGFSL